MLYRGSGCAAAPSCYSQLSWQTSPACFRWQEVEEDIEEQLEASAEFRDAAGRSIMDQSLSDLQGAPPVVPTPRRPDAADLERHRSLTDSIESLIHKSEQKDQILSAAKEVFDRAPTAFLLCCCCCCWL